MSYEGYEEYLCKQGHYFRVDAWNDDTVSDCPTCKGKVQWHHSVDTTNGPEEDCPGTHPAPKISTIIEVQNTDHRGNTYYVFETLFKPDSVEWKPFDDRVTTTQLVLNQVQGTEHDIP